MIKNNKVKYLFILPAILLTLIFIIWPLFELFKLSLYKTNFITTKFVGLENYLMIFQDPKFVQSIVNSLFYIILLVIGQIGGATFLSLLVCNLSKKWHDFTRFAFYIPLLSSGLIISQFWKWIFHMNGPLNWLLGLFGIAPVMWFAQSITGIPAVALVVIVASWGTNVIIILAAILSIEQSMVEQARIDGASWFQIKMKIILPQLWSTIILLSFVSAINAIAIIENIIFLAPYQTTATLVYAVYDYAFTMGKHGLASAGAVFILVISVFLSLIKNKIERNNISNKNIITGYGLYH